MIVFDGEQLAARLEQDLKKEVADLEAKGIRPKIAAILFQEDLGSQLYTQLKSEAAERVGIDCEVHTFWMKDGTEAVEKKIAELNQDQSVTGIIIQKPWRNTWVKAKGVATDKGQKAVRQAFNAWWQFLTSQIVLQKDVDGLHPQTLKAIKNHQWQQQQLVLPATAQAVLTILQQAAEELKIPADQLKTLQIFILGRSDIVGQPVFYELQNQGFEVSMLTKNDVEQLLSSAKKLTAADVIISATGVNNLITGEMIKKGVILIDVGEPLADAEFASIKDKVTFVTPVPGGVGPLTVVCLLKNCVTISA